MFKYRIDYQIKGSIIWRAYELIENFKSTDVDNITRRLKRLVPDVKCIRVMKHVCYGLFWKKDHQLTKRFKVK